MTIHIKAGATMSW